MATINEKMYSSIKNSMKVFDIIEYPCISIKSKKLNTTLSQVVVFVDINASKNEIKGAIEAIFGMKVSCINTMIVKGKNKRVSGSKGNRSFYSQKDKKKAIVSFKDKDLAKKMQQDQLVESNLGADLLEKKEAHS